MLPLLLLEGSLLENKHHLTGWFQALFAVLVLWGVSNVFMGTAVRTWDCHPIVFSCVVFTSASLGLLMFSGYGRLASETARSIDTWAYGILLMLNYIVFLALLAIISSTETTLLQAVSVVVSIFAGWFFIGRKISFYQIVGALLILIGVVLVFSDLVVDNFGHVLLLVIIMGIIQTVRTYVAEFHRPHKYASEQLFSVKDRARVIALVMFVVSTLFFVTSLMFAVLMHFVPEITIPTAPLINDFLNPYTVVFAMIAGFILVAPLRFFEFSATHSIKTENYLAVSAFAPAATWFWEYVGVQFVDINMHSLTKIDAIACALITLGGLVIAYSKMHEASTKKEKWIDYLSYEAQNLENVEDSREIVASTLQHLEGNTDKTAKLLEVPIDVVRAIISDDSKILAFKKEVLNKVARNYRHKVANSDSLTGLLNRGGFMSELQKHLDNKSGFSLLYIDLDKFKPVNDTYGHDIGDIILKGVADRLREVCPKDAIITRMGGDEYCVLLPNADKLITTKRASDIKQSIAKPFDVDGIKAKVEIGASVGTAIYPHDGKSADKLLSVADGSMYGAKKSNLF